MLRSHPQSEREIGCRRRARRAVSALGLVAALAAGCSADEAAPPEDTSTSAGPVTTVPGAVTTTDAAAPVRAEPLDRRVLVVYESESDGEMGESLEFEFAGVVRPGPDVWTFAGMSAVRSSDRSLALGPFRASQPGAAGAGRNLFSTGYDPEIPRPVVSADGTVVVSDTELFLDGVGSLGYTATVAWEVIDVTGTTVVVRGRSEIDDAFSARGAPQEVTGIVEAELRVDLDDPFRVDGWFVFDGRYRSSSGPSIAATQRQEFRTEDADWPAGDEWIEGVSPPSRGGEPTPEEPGVGFVTYGGGSWSGTLRITDDWSAVATERRPGLITLELQVGSSFTPLGQWIEFEVTEWEAEHPFVGDGDEDPEDVRGAVSIDPYGEITLWYRGGTSEVDARSFHTFLGNLLTRLLPPLPPVVMTPGTTWTTQVDDGDLHGARTYELVELADGVAEFTVTAEVGVYHGDRYSGESYAGTLVGRIFVDVATGVPIDVDLSTTGTVTSGVAGVEDPSTSTPWQQTLTAAAMTPVDSRDG